MEKESKNERESVQISGIGCSPDSATSIQLSRCRGVEHSEYSVVWPRWNIPGFFAAPHIIQALFTACHVTRRNTYYGGARVINWIVALHYSCFRRASKLFDSFRIQPVDRWTTTTPSKTAAWQTCRLHRRVSYRPRNLPPPLISPPRPST